MRSETRMRDCLNRVGVAIISKFPHLAPLPPPLRPHRGVRRRASRLQTSAPRTGVGFRPEIGTGAGCSGAGTGREGLVRECGTAGKTATPCPALPTRQPQAAALCLSRKMVWESLRGREGRPHHSPLNVNYAFKTVFIGEAARHPMPPRPVCVLPRPALRAARHAQVLRGGAHPVTGAGAREEEGRAWRCGQSMRAKVMGAARTVCTLVAVLPRAHAHGERGRGGGWDGSVCRGVAVTLSL